MKIKKALIPALLITTIAFSPIVYATNSIEKNTTNQTTTIETNSKTEEKSQVQTITTLTDGETGDGTNEEGTETGDGTNEEGIETDDGTDEEGTGTGEGDQSEEVQWTDVSNAKFTIIKEINNKYSSYYIKTEGITFIENHNYYLLVSNSPTKPSNDNKIRIYTDSGKSSSIQPYIEKNGDIYIWLYESQYQTDSLSNPEKELISARKLERPAQNTLGNRILAYFFNSYTSTFIFENQIGATSNNIASLKINVKIGYVTDINILKAIRDGKSGCLTDLLNYAKSANSIYTCTVPIGDSETITNKFDLIDGQYYYVYMELDDENGTYYPLEDVSLYQALVDESVGKNLFDYLSDSFKWNLEDDATETPSGDDETPAPTPSPTPSPDNTTAGGKLPDTGKSITLVIVCSSLIIAGAFGYIQYKRYKEIK